MRLPTPRPPLLTSLRPAECNADPWPRAGGGGGGGGGGGEDLRCQDCDKGFRFTAGQQRFHAEKGIPAPTRCSECKRAVKTLQCRFCDNVGHAETECRLKESATCKECGAVGGCCSKGFAQASGRNNVRLMGCMCGAKGAGWENRQSEYRAEYTNLY